MHQLPGLPREHTGLVALLLVAVTVRLAYSLLVHPDGLVWADEVTYDGIAWRLATSGEYVSHAYSAAPGFPALLAAVYTLFGHDYTAARVAQALLGGVLVVAVAATGSLFFGRRVGHLAGFVTAIYPPLVYLAAVLYADHLAAVLLASSVWVLAAWRKTPGSGRLVLAGALLAATALTRPVYLLVVPVAAAYVLLESPPGRRVRWAALLAATATLVIAPWTVRNASAFGHFVPISVGFGQHLWAGNNDVSLGNADDRHLLPDTRQWHLHAARLPGPVRDSLAESARALKQEIDRLDAVEFDARLSSEGRRWIVAHPGGFLRLSLGRLRTLYSPYSRTQTQDEVRSPRNVLLATVSLLPILILGLPGVVLALRRERAAWVVPAIIATITLTYSALTAATRFRLPIDPLWILLASVTAVALRERLRARATSSR